MSVLIYGVQFRCDLCQAIGDRPGRVPADPPVVFSNLPVPEGWANLALLSLTFKDFYGAYLQHLCETCAALDIGQIAARLNAQLEPAKAAS
jgi:hypothetical protein